MLHQLLLYAACLKRMRRDEVHQRRGQAVVMGQS